ncbi:decarboxylase [Limnohabitans sp. 2KL-1]|uniref:malonyl-CoA decarboxylase n=1 Tax=Limnohabitans sp. 2KL-1 TaxID=1100699 RepID=UPI000D33F7D5|nr:malonyl-CoA decarboxylase [Limnohabitans sp. 2KL-1]PUE49500.1 decarboxylase [Limnohabitans sp. 2KL-1]
MLERFIQNKKLDAAKLTVRKLLSARGEANAQSMAVKLIDNYDHLDKRSQTDFFHYLSSELNPDPVLVMAAANRYNAERNEASLIELCQTVEPPRQELLRRVNRAPAGTATILGMRQTLLSYLKDHPAFRATDADMHHLLSSWFNPGFLELHQITWNSPAQLLEKIIEHESVHAIDGWDDLRRRLQPDRRCFAFFHPQLPGEPLIFVEVALVPGIAKNIAGLIDKQAPVGDAKSFKAAIFYSISNCQPGLKGVSLGNFLIKRVAQKLLEEMPSLKTFCTLSPIPGFTQWLDAGAPLPEERLSPALTRKWQDAQKCVAVGSLSWAERLKSGWHPERSDGIEKNALLRLCALYLMHKTPEARGDAVGKFHLSNGATLHQINWAADLSKKGLQQSGGIMVNYLYELDKVEEQHEAFSHKTVSFSRSVEKLV